jgi:hypothetical protein
VFAAAYRSIGHELGTLTGECSIMRPETGRLEHPVVYPVSKRLRHRL